MKRENKTKYVILGALSYAPMSGYDIRKWISQVTLPFWSESDGQIYPTLAELVKGQFVKREIVNSLGKRIKKVYQITPSGYQLLKEWLGVTPCPTWVRNEFLLKLFLGKNLAKQENIKHLQDRLAEINKTIEKYKSVVSHIKITHQNDKESFYWLLSLNYGIAHCHAEQVWCTDSLNSILNDKG